MFEVASTSRIEQSGQMADAICTSRSVSAAQPLSTGICGSSTPVWPTLRKQGAAGREVEIANAGDEPATVQVVSIEGRPMVTRYRTRSAATEGAS